MAGLHGESLQVIPYDREEHDFVAPVREALGVSDLAKIHKTIGYVALRTRTNDSRTPLHQR